MRPDPACEYGMHIGQRFRVEPGRFYRVRVRSHLTHRSDADRPGPASSGSIQYSIGARLEFIFLSDGEDSSGELTLLAPNGAYSGSVMIRSSRLTEALEIEEIAVEDVPLGFGDCFDILAAEFDAFYTFPCGSRAEWNETVAELRPAARRAVNSEAFSNILIAALASLRDAEIRTVTNMGDVTRIEVIYGGEDIPPPQSSGSDPGPNERLLRLPCGPNIIYRAW